METVKRLIITPGEPAGIGPDITVQVAQLPFQDELIVIADPHLLKSRADQLQLPLDILPFDETAKPSAHRSGSLRVIPVSLAATCRPGQLDVRNAAYVLETLRIATDHCLQQKAAALITGPIQKSLLNDASIPFTGHTEYLAERCGVKQSVMFFVADMMKVALLTTHLPLKDVAAAITKERLHYTLKTLHHTLQTRFRIAKPHILVTGLNPHAGEAGHLGREEIEIIIPTLEALKAEGLQLSGPYPADGLFGFAKIEGDAILAMYHDQALPVVKYASLGQAVNMTLGLPILRTSVDHGTALDAAGTLRAKPESLIAAIHLASRLA